MKIRTQLIISIVLFGIALLIIAASVVITNQQVERLNEQQQIVNNIELGAGELGYLSYDYLQYHESQQLDRWELKYSSFSDDVSNLTIDRPEQQILVNNIKKNQQRLKDVFDDAVSRFESANQDNIVSPEYIQASWSRISIIHREIAYDASLLSQMLQDENKQVERTNTLIILALLGTFGAFILADYLLIFGHTIKSLANLQAGTRVIGSGNLDHTIIAKTGDEVGELADAFNRMTSSLKTVTASKKDLEREITERKQAEAVREQLLAQLKDKTSMLEHANEELELKSEELSAQAEAIERSNNELRTNYEELQRMTNSLSETQNYLESLINYANAPIIVWDPRFTIIRFNHAFERLSGYTANEVMGKSLSILFPPDSRVESLNNIKKTLEGEQWESVEIPILHKSNGVRIALWNSANIYSADRTLLATIAQGQDITRRKQAEKDLEEAKAQAELYLDLMGHDINNMHQIAIGYLELASENIGLSTGDRDLIDKPLEVMRRSAKLIDNVRKLQKVHAGGIKDDAVDLNEVLASVIGEYEGVIDGTIAYDNGKEPHRVMANELLYDVFSNLLSNAVKHCNGGPVSISIGLDRVQEDGRSFYRVAVEDNGPGIPDAMKDRIFNRLQRGKTEAKGVGLGLYLVKSLVESYRGRIWAEDRIPGDHTRGSRFIVMLPAI